MFDDQTSHSTQSPPSLMDPPNAVENDAQGGVPVTRRGMIQTGIAVAGCSLLPAPRPGSAAGQAATPPGYIDAHVHVWTPDTKRYPLASGFTPSDMQPPSFTPEQLMAHAAPQGVDRVVLIQMSYYQTDNAYMLDVIRDHPGVYAGVAMIDETDRPRQRMLQLAERGVRGFRIQPADRPADAWLQGAGMQEMWRCGGDEGLALCHLINPRHLPSVDDMCRRFPATTVVIDHLARIGSDGVIRPQDVANLCRLARHGRVFVKASAFYALGKKQPPYLDLAPFIRQVFDAFGPDRLMWASDCPFQVAQGQTYRDSIDLIAGGLDFLRDDDRQRLLRTTAERIFFP